MDTTAYCNSTGGLQQLNADGSVSTAATISHATTGEPNRVLPTIAGNQLIAVRINVIGSSSAATASLVRSGSGVGGAALAADPRSDPAHMASTRRPARTGLDRQRSA